MDEVLYTIEDGIATLTLNRPAKLNAVTPQMSDEIVRAAKDASANPQVRVLVLTGSGDRAFCAGSDIAELDQYDSPWAFRNRPDYCDAIRRITKPTICAVNGIALGGGLELALSCDIRLAAEGARFGAPEIKLGWIGGGGVSAFLVHTIGLNNAAVMLYTGDPVDADTALRWGLVAQAVPAGTLADAARKLASTIAQRAPIAAQTAKLNLRAAVSMGLEQAVQYERDLQTICMGTADAAEGRAAFKEKRPAQFRGA
ncbi:enoyl-CoA hydratase/isomerase family protein [Bordetella sp. 2513F-2]